MLSTFVVVQSRLSLSFLLQGEDRLTVEEFEEVKYRKELASL